MNDCVFVALIRESCDSNDDIHEVIGTSAASDVTVLLWNWTKEQCTVLHLSIDGYCELDV